MVTPLKNASTVISVSAPLIGCREKTGSKIERCQYIKNDQYGDNIVPGAGSDMEANIKCV